MRAFLAVLAVVLFFVLISCSSTEASPTSTSGGKDNGSIQSTTVTHSTFESVGTVFNSCSSELVDYDGRLKLTIKSKDQGNGSTSVQITTDIKAKGTGRTTGTEYEVISSTGSSNTFDMGPPFPREFSFDQERKLVSKGSSDNAVITFSISASYNENGTLTDFSVDSSTECK